MGHLIHAPALQVLTTLDGIIKIGNEVICASIHGPTPPNKNETPTTLVQDGGGGLGGRLTFQLLMPSSNLFKYKIPCIQLGGGGGCSGGSRLTFQLLMLKSKAAKIRNSLCLVGRGGGEVDFPTFDAVFLDKQIAIPNGPSSIMCMRYQNHPIICANCWGVGTTSNSDSPSSSDAYTVWVP